MVVENVTVIAALVEPGDNNFGHEHNSLSEMVTLKASTRIYNSINYSSLNVDMLAKANTGHGL